MRKCVRMGSMGLTAARSVTARTTPSVGRTMANVSVIPAGWGIGARKCARKDFTATTVWSRATVRWDFLSAIRQRAASAA